MADGGDLDHVGVEFLALLGDVLEIDGRGLDVVVADDPLGLAEAADLGGDVHLEVDVIDPEGDGLAQELLPLFLVAAPETAVDSPANREDHRRGTVLQDPLQVRRRGAGQSIRSSTSSDPGLGCFLPFLEQARSAGLARSLRRSFPHPATDTGHARTLRRVATPEMHNRHTPLDDCTATLSADERGRCHDLV